MIAQYIVFNLLGKITKLLTVDEADIEANLAEDEAAMLGYCDMQAWYVTGGTLTEKPEFTEQFNKTTINADGNDSASITGLPAGTEIVITGAFYAVYDVDDGEFEINTTNPGTYNIKLSPFPYREFTVTINAV